MPLFFSIVLKRKKEMPYVPLAFGNGLTIDTLVDSGAYVSAIASKELHIIQQQAPASIFKIDHPRNFPIQVANVLLEKPLATATLKFDIGDHILAEDFVEMKNFTEPFGVALHETQQCGHRHYTWPHPFPTLDNASQKFIERNECQTSSCSHSRQYKRTTNDNKNNHSICRSLIGMKYNRYRDSSRKFYSSRESDNIPFNFNNFRQIDSSQCHEHNVITSYD